MDLSLRPQLDQVSAVREFLESYYKLAVDDLDLISRMAMAAHELLENAAKYSAEGPSHLHVGVKNGARRPSLCVSVSSVPLPEHLRGLRRVVEELTEAADPDATYLAFLGRAAKRTRGSGLGLARIRAEAEMSLQIEVRDGRVCVEALAPLPDGGER